MINTIEFVHQVGYSEKQMYDLFKGDPKLLLEGLGKKLYLLLGRLIKFGVDVNVVTSCFVEHPDMLSSERVENLMTVIAFLYNIRMEQDDIEHVLTNYMHILSKHSIKGQRTVCMELRIGKADLCRIIKDDPLELICLASKTEKKRVGREQCCDPRNYLDKTTFLLKLSYIENSEEMEEATKMFKGRGDLLQERFDCLVEAGLDYNSVVSMIKRDPRILNLKRTVLEKKIDFMKNTSVFPLECVVRYPAYFSHDLGLLSARFSMYQWLKKRNAINRAISLCTIVSYTEKKFVKFFVNMDPEAGLEFARCELAESEKELRLLTSVASSSDKEYVQIRKDVAAIEKKLDNEMNSRKKLEEELMVLNSQIDELKAETAVQQVEEEIRVCKNMIKCTVCSNRPKEAVIVKCYHLFCNPCIQRNLELRHHKCPACGTAFGRGQTLPHLLLRSVPMGTLSLLHNPNLYSHFRNPNFSPPSSLSLKSPIRTNSRSKSTHIPALSSSTPIRIKLATKIEAQRALMDYLGFTRNYTFIDAEFITINSPHFIDNLISKINIKNGNVFRSLQSDDSRLVDNFHVLYNHGVPRNRIGKIYKEAREVFRYDNGVLAKTFRDYEDLDLSKSSFIKLVVCCPLLLVGDVDSDFVAVLD
ncbi:hypothetical protein TSUD_249030 [Trifolium subterraneum]|uniref:E3 ubiquitin protein ligase n=1 Tax=Trifolium subterraneum TaxID=3900 RepID=A0A2Z6LKA7_TRISU|nr:hypothetical protein TSUD_249030 [Trifolium subterraneum]